MVIELRDESFCGLPPFFDLSSSLKTSLQLDPILSSLLLALLLDDMYGPFSSFFSNLVICCSWRLMCASFSALSLESLSSLAFMLANVSSKLTASIIIASMMNVWDDLISNCERTDLLGDGIEESLM